MFEDKLKNIEKIEPLIDITGKQEISAMAKFLYERIKNHDSYLVFLGETSSGKSSLINGFLDADVLPMKARPTTAAITEVEISSRSSDSEYFAINRDATIEKIDRNLFLQLSEHPDENLKRLKITKSVQNSELENLRIFDTPGYGSIIDEHEEVLKEFLPNSDIIVYTVNYKIGIQDEDYVFLGFLRELIRPDVKIFLLINRCPVGTDDKKLKVRKIFQIVSDVLTIDPMVLTVDNIETEGNDGHPLPNCQKLWEGVSKGLSSPERTESLNRAFNGYIKDLYNECYKVIESRYLSSKMSAEEFEEFINLQQDYAHHIRQAIPKYVVPTFDRIEKALPRKFNEARDNVGKKLDAEIDKSSSMDMEEMVGYTNSHLLPHIIKDEATEIQHYIDVELDDLNRKVDDYIQKELIDFNNQISIKIQTNLDAATSNLAASILNKLGTSSLESYFFAFGGMGGANAGVANAASHLLKKAGDLFGHTFSRATHNGVKHFLAKIGATSMKAIGAAVAVITELLFTSYQLATWKGKLKDKVKESLDKWEEQTFETVKEDLVKLREENIDTIRKIADDIAHSFDSEKPEDIDKCKEDYLYAKKIGKEIGIE